MGKRSGGDEGAWAQEGCIGFKEVPLIIVKTNEGSVVYEWGCAQKISFDGQKLTCLVDIVPIAAAFFDASESVDEIGCGRKIFWRKEFSRGIDEIPLREMQLDAMKLDAEWVTGNCHR